jgi:gliding motility-associated-like protein
VYTAYVSDPTNCYTVEKQFYIFGFPKFFTPNNDGYNDYWEIKGINKSLYSYSDVLVFDRFGKFLVKFKADANWNGSYNGNRLPPDDYWYKISVTDQKNNTISHTGHFSIVR